MKALTVVEAGRLQVRDIAKPQIGPYQALVQMEVCGICNSTDQKLIEGTMYWAPPFPYVLGHESVGRVVEVGERVTKFRVGDRVTRPIYIPPQGEAMHSANGGFAEYGIVTDAEAMAADGDNSLLDDYNATRQMRVPAWMSARDAALCISLSETASVLRHLPNPRGQKVVVAGTGVAGLAFVLWLKLSGAFVISLGRRDERLKVAQELGADAVVNTSHTEYLSRIEEIAGGKVDGLIEATGDASLAHELLKVAQPEGFTTAYGVPPTGTTYAPRWQVPSVEEHLSFYWVADLMKRGWIKPEWFVSHEWTFEEIELAFETSAKAQVTKGFILFDY